MVNNDASSESLPYNPSNCILPGEKVAALLQQYGVSQSPRDANLYRKAMIHRSYCTRKNENFVSGNVHCPENCLPLQEESNERLEFLGDAVLNLVVANYLYERYPDENEGFLTKMRTKLVNGKMLCQLFLHLELEPYVIMSRQVEETQGRRNDKILEDVFEAWLGAMHMDFGFATVQTWIVEFLETHIDFSDLMMQNNNYKDMLLKYFQYTFSMTPKFTEVTVDNTAQGKTYTLCIKDKKDNIVGTGKGNTKKAAENEASRQALLYYGQSITTTMDGEAPGR